MTTTSIDSIEDRDDLFETRAVQDPSHVLLDDHEDAGLIRRTKSAALPNIAFDLPHNHDRLDPSRVRLLTLKEGQSILGAVKEGLRSLSLEGAPTPKPKKIDSPFALAAEGSRKEALKRSSESAPAIDEATLAPVSEKVNETVADLKNYRSELETIADEPNPPAPDKLNFPNLAWEAVLAGLIKENITNNQLKDHIDEAKKHQKDIDLLLDLSAELSALKEEHKEMPEKAQNILNELKERGIDLWKHETNELSKEKISDLKSLSGAQIDKLRSNLQILFTTKIQVMIQAIGAILECIKDIIRNNTKLINAANRLPGH